MRKYLFRYLIFWLPAFVVNLLASYVFRGNGGAVLVVFQWLTAFFMLFGWSVNTGMAARRYPRHTLSLLFGYTGIHILIILWYYSSSYGTVTRQLLAHWGGLFSYWPLDIFVVAILNLDIRHELYVLGLLVACCFVGFLAGCVYRKLRPDPYRPRIRRSGY